MHPRCILQQGTRRCTAVGTPQPNAPPVDTTAGLAGFRPLLRGPQAHLRGGALVHLVVPQAALGGVGPASEPAADSLGLQGWRARWEAVVWVGGPGEGAACSSAQAA